MLAIFAIVCSPDLVRHYWKLWGTFSLVDFLIDESGWQRRTAVLWMASLIWAARLPAALSLGPFATVRIAGLGIFDLMDYVTVNLLMPAGGILVAVFVGWVIWPRIQAKLTLEGTSRSLRVPFLCLCGIIAPMAISAIWYHTFH